jgi:hypothetical protein
MAISRLCLPSPVRSFMAGFSLVGVLGVASVTAPVAQADAMDDQFMGALQAHGITFATPQAAIAAGHHVCDELDSGTQKPDVANEVSINTNLDGYHAGYFVGLSVAAYCPGHHSSP